MGDGRWKGGVGVCHCWDFGHQINSKESELTTLLCTFKSLYL